MPSSCFSPRPPAPAPDPQFPSTDSPTELPLISKTVPIPISFELFRTCSFKIKHPEDPEDKRSVLYIAWTKAEL